MKDDEVRHKSLQKSDANVSTSQNSKKMFLYIILTSFCYVCILVASKQTDILYYCKMYYEEKAVLEWKIMFTVVKHLDALQQVTIYHV